MTVATIPMRRDWLPDLASIDEKGLRRVHVRVMREVFRANGLRRMGLGVIVLKPVEAEMRLRGLEADYWSHEHWLRSNEAFRAEPD